METHSSRSSGRSLRRLAALVAVAFAAIAGFTTLSGFVAASRAEADTCANYTYCLGFRSTMNNSALDGIYWSNEPTEQAVTDQNPVHGLWGVQFETWTDHAPMTIQNGVYVDGGTSPNTSYRDHAIFQLRSLSQPGGCLTGDPQSAKPAAGDTLCQQPADDRGQSTAVLSGRGQRWRV